MANGEQSNGNNGGRRQGRYQFLQASFGPKIFELLQQDELGQSFGDDMPTAFEKFASFDPTSEANGKKYGYLQWLCSRYVQSHEEGHTPINAEDLETIREDLEFFIDLKKRRRHENFQKDINQHTPQTLADLREEYSNTQKAKSKSELLRDLKKAIRRNTVIHYEGEEGIIISPRTKSAAKFWGQGTTWCVSAGFSQNYFHHYNQYGPLVMYLPHKNDDGLSAQRKYIGNVWGGLRDASNCSVIGMPDNLRRLVEEALEEAPQIANVLVSKGSYPLSEVKTESVEAWRNLLHDADDAANAYYIISRMPQATWNDTDFQKKLLKKDPAFFGNIPEHYKTKSLYLTAALLATAKGRMMDYISVTNQIPASCWRDKFFTKTLVGNDPEIIARVPPNNRTKDVCLTALKFIAQSKDKTAIDSVLENIPPRHWQDTDFCGSAADYTAKSRDYMSADMQAQIPRATPVQNGLAAVFSLLGLNREQPGDGPDQAQGNQPNGRDNDDPTLSP